jgi:hypothetical protein
VVHARPQLSRDPLGREEKKDEFTATGASFSFSVLRRPHASFLTAGLHAGLVHGYRFSLQGMGRRRGF